MGRSDTEGNITAVYENQEGSFVKTENTFERVADGEIAWVDINKDGYLDLVVSGYLRSPKTNVYMSVNNGESFESTDQLPNLFGT